MTEATGEYIRQADIEAVVLEVYKRERQREWEEFKAGCAGGTPMPAIPTSHGRMIPAALVQDFLEALFEPKGPMMQAALEVQNAMLRLKAAMGTAPPPDPKTVASA